MKSRALAIAGLVATVVVLATSLFFATRGPSKDAADLPSPMIGKTAPALVGQTLQGASWDLRSQRGHVVVVNFWASWCGPCKTEGPELSTFAWQQRQRHGAVVVGVVFNDSTSAALAFEQHYGNLYPSIIDNDGAFANAYGVTSPPTTYVIDRNGRIAAVFFGATTEKQLNATIASIAS